MLRVEGAEERGTKLDIVDCSWEEEGFAEGIEFWARDMDKSSNLRSSSEAVI